jgi:hypothetical protein
MTAYSTQVLPGQGNEPMPDEEAVQCLFRVCSVRRGEAPK